jgi:uncharacterized protein YjbJ (UPF0337 family)
MRINSRGNGCSSKVNCKQKYGKFSDDDLQQIEGNYDTFLGKAQERYGDKKDELMKWADQWYQQLALEATKGKKY